MKVLVTGGIGFIGSHLANYLKSKGDYVRVVDIKPVSHCYLPLKADEIVQADLRDLELAMKATENMNWVFALSADMGGMGYLGVKPSNAQVMLNNSQINLNTIKASLENKVKRLFFSSSACVYPIYKQSCDEEVSLKEEDAYPAMPDLGYGWEKLQTERLLLACKDEYGLDVRIARFHNIYGCHCNYNNGREKAPAALARKVAEVSDGGDVVVWGDGEQKRSFLHINDCLEAIYLLMKSNYSKPINIGSDQAITINQLAKMLIGISGKKLSLTHDLNKPQGVRSRNADLTLIHQVLDWTPTISYRDGLKRLYKWVEERVSAEEVRYG